MSSEPPPPLRQDALEEYYKIIQITHIKVFFYIILLLDKCCEA